MGTPRQPLSLVGAPIECGANIVGSALGPSALRTAGLRGTLGELGCEVIDHGDLMPAPRVDLACLHSGEHSRRRMEGTEWIQCLSKTAYELARGGHLPVFLGGDHSLAMGTIDGIARACAENGKVLYVLWLDAHPDFNTPATSPSGNLHGMSLAFLCGEPGFEPVLGAPACKTVDLGKVFLFGVRSIDAGEDDALRRRGANLIDMREIGERGVAAPMECILETVAKHDGVLHVSLDADFVDPTCIPAVNVPAPGGIAYAEARLIMDMLKDSGLVVSLDVAELNPLLDPNRRSARAVAKLVASLFDRKSEIGHEYSRRESRDGRYAAQVH